MHQTFERPKSLQTKRGYALRSLGMALAAASLALALALAACGSAQSKPKPSASYNSAFALSGCMRAHGVPNYPDPTVGSGGEGFQIMSSPGSSVLTVDGVTFAGPAFEAAEKTCKLFGGGNGPGAIPAAQVEGMVAVLSPRQASSDPTAQTSRRRRRKPR